MCDGFLGIKLPCIIMYSRLLLNQKLYPATLTFFALMRLTVLLYSMVDTQIDLLKEEYEGDLGDDLQIARSIFNGWEFRNNNKKDYKNTVEGIKNRL